MADLSSLSIVAAVSEAVGMYPATVLTGIVEDHERQTTDETRLQPSPLNAPRRQFQLLVSVTVPSGVDVDREEVNEYIAEALAVAGESAYAHSRRLGSTIIENHDLGVG